MTGVTKRNNMSYTMLKEEKFGIFCRCCMRQPSRAPNSDDYIYIPSQPTQGSESDAMFGPMRLRQIPMTVLLVFSKEDSQSDGFWWACDKAGFKCNIAHNTESVMEACLEKQYDVIIIDTRHSKSFDPEALCRSLKATKSSEHAVIIAVTKKHTSDKEEPSIAPLLSAGFNRRYIENLNVGTCLNELLSIEQHDVRLQHKVRAAGALFTALDNCHEGIHITNEHRETQYINPACERLLGYTCEETQGKDITELLRSDKNKQDLEETINSQVKKGKHWEGAYYIKRKNGQHILHHCYTTPVMAKLGKVRHTVSIRSTHDHNNMPVDRYKDGELTQNGGIHSFPKRRESVARIHSMTIEAPITKVINIINAAQENSPMMVSQALDKVLEILRTSELYSPHLQTQQVREEDQMTSDYVGGLMTGTVKRRSSYGIDVKTSHGHTPHIPKTIKTLSQIPVEIQNATRDEAKWDFNVLNLEEVSNKRPLVYLGLKTFARFGVCSFLNCSETVLHNWLQIIEANYHSKNSYHNSTHAADVMQASAYFLERERIKAIFDQMDEVAALIAAVIHDVDHPGRTNSFLVNSGDRLAFLYNDLAVLESHHVALAFQITSKDDDVNIFKNMDRDDFRALRQSVIDMVMATEMTKHFEHLSKFVSSINKPPGREEEDSVHSGRGTPESSTSISHLNTPENRTLIKRMLIKCADVSNPTRPLYLCKEWALRIAEEYFSQTEEEKEKGLPVVMPVFDRKTCSLPKSQVSFLDFFIHQMFDAWDAFCDCGELISYLQNNYQYWKEQQELQEQQEKQDTSL
ncbi:unnamed protein product [Owenia fusiformis]|uniref:Phosphodiesterase n=1 Tax=Owenia fusiformis TaxID=6347 RepID=A0A8S4PXC5_OWEFU|nr:unnamed protein product [Owenia fusiformis]